MEREHREEFKSSRIWRRKRRYEVKKTRKIKVKGKGWEGKVE